MVKDVQHHNTTELFFTKWNFFCVEHHVYIGKRKNIGSDYIRKCGFEKSTTRSNFQIFALWCRSGPLTNQLYHSVYKRLTYTLLNKKS